MPDLTVAVGAEVAPQRTHRLICPLPRMALSISQSLRFVTLAPSWAFQLSLIQAETFEGGSCQVGVQGPVVPPVPDAPPAARTPPAPMAPPPGRTPPVAVAPPVARRPPAPVV